MFDISEAGAAAYNWVTGKIKGVDISDVVLGGVTGEANKSATDLTLRSANLNIRLAVIEQMLLSDPDNVINNLKDILDAFSGETEQVALISMLAKKACNVTTTADKASWVAALQLALRTYNLNTTEKATWVSGLGIASIAATEAASAANALHQSLDNNEFAQIVNAFNTVYNNPSNNISLTMGGGGNTFSLNVANWRAKLGLSRAVIMLGRCEVLLGDPGGGSAGFYGCSIGYNVGISAVYRRPPGSYSIGSGTVSVPANTSLYQVNLTTSVNPHKVVMRLVHQGNPPNWWEEALYIGVTGSSYFFILREGSAIGQNLYSHIFIYGEVGDYQ